jgi:uncharacterized protein YecE (DUF72 family)
LAAYARAFPFVEVNATFYEWPSPPRVASWRRRVPAGFRFAVRTHRDLTHRHRLAAGPASRASLARTAKIAERLAAVAIVLETPVTDPFDAARAAALRDLLGAANLPCPVALEARAHRDHALPSPLAALMEDHDVADAVDFSRQAPRTRSSLAYGRIFGLGDGNRWEFTDDELAAVRQNAESTGAARIAYTFHGVRMYKDAGRFLTYVRTGSFPRATRHTGVRSLEEALGEAAGFPATKADLVRDHGWRVLDLAGDRRVHANVLLQELPSGRYGSLAEVVRALATQGR